MRHFLTSEMLVMPREQLGGRGSEAALCYVDMLFGMYVKVVI